MRAVQEAKINAKRQRQEDTVARIQIQE